MAISKATVDANLRTVIFDDLFNGPSAVGGFTRINDRQYGIILTDLNGVERYVRIGAIVAEEREDMTARELMQSEIDAYHAKQEEKAAKAKARAEKMARDKAKREAAQAENGE